MRHVASVVPYTRRLLCLGTDELIPRDRAFSKRVIASKRAQEEKNSTLQAWLSHVDHLMRVSSIAPSRAGPAAHLANTAYDRREI
jgi:hypothetical protein